ncbi:MAG TPA: hypothetical protein VFW92_01515 [Candidatus Limnocylindrales bacterium]|nr:hypothetical protein [Candidatus Limnocylindrales bacterium]
MTDPVTILAAAGMLVDGPQEVLDEEIPSFDTFSDPQATTTVARALATDVARLEPQVILVWDDPDECVLAHVVALELGIRWARAYDDSGMVHVVGDLEGSRAVLLADAFRTGYRLRALAEVVRQRGGHLVGAAALVPSQALAEAAQVLGVPSITIEGR